jgi:hypothetical protein
MRWRRLRKWAKWGCTVAAVLAAALAVFSGFYRYRWSRVSTDGLTAWITQVGDGALRVLVIHDRNASELRTHSHSSLERSEHWAWGPWTWKSGTAGERIFHAGFQYWRETNSCLLGVNLLYPVLLVTIPGALLWYSDRRRLVPGLCPKCGYDRHGLAADAKCPECGTVPAPAA